MRQRGGVDVKVFISWSGEPSRSIAKALRDWIPTVVQHIQPWMSDEEIKSGSRWNDEVGAALDETNFGVVCVTASNQHEPWLMFEAGALAKRLEVARVVPLCLDLAPADVTGPLSSFQGRCLDEDGMKRLVQEMMILRENPPAQGQIDCLFKAMWPTLESQVRKAELQSPGPRPSQRSSQEMLEELVERVRRIERDQAPRAQGGITSSGLAATATDVAAPHDHAVMTSRASEHRYGQPPEVQRPE